MTVNVNDSPKKRRLGDKNGTTTSQRTVTKTQSDPNFRKCNHCGKKINRKKKYAVEHINICSSYNGNKFDSSGEETTGDNKKDKDSKKSKSVSNKNKNKNKNVNTKDSSDSEDSDSDAYAPTTTTRQQSISNYTVKIASKAEQEIMNQWLAKGIATSGSISHNAITTNIWFQKIFDRCGFKPQCWDAIKKKIFVYEKELKEKTDKYLSDNVKTATIGFDGSSDKCKESLTAYGAFIPQSLLIDIRRPKAPGKQTAEKCFEELKDVAEKTEARTGTKFTKAVNDSCEQQKKNT